MFCLARAMTHGLTGFPNDSDVGLPPALLSVDVRSVVAGVWFVYLSRWPVLCVGVFNDDVAWWYHGYGCREQPLLFAVSLVRGTRHRENRRIGGRDGGRELILLNW